MEDILKNEVTPTEGGQEVVPDGPDVSLNASEHTEVLELSQFTENDRPTWLGDYNSDMRKIDTSVKALNSSAASQDKDIMAIQNDITDIKTNINALQVEDNEINQKIADTNTDLEAVTVRVQKNETDIEELQRTVGSSTKELDERVTDLEQQGLSHGNAIAALNRETEAQQESIDKNTDDIKYLKDDVADLKLADAAINTRIDTTVTFQNNLKTQVDANTEALKELEGLKPTEVDARFTAIENEVDGLETRVATVEEDVNTTMTNVTALQTTTTNLSTQVTEAKTAADNATTTAGEAKTAADGAATAAGEAKTAADGAATAAGNNATAITGLDTRVTALEEGGGGASGLNWNYTHSTLQIHIENSHWLSITGGVADIFILEEDENKLIKKAIFSFSYQLKAVSVASIPSDYNTTVITLTINLQGHKIAIDANTKYQITPMLISTSNFVLPLRAIETTPITSAGERQTIPLNVRTYATGSANSGDPIYFIGTFVYCSN